MDHQSNPGYAPEEEPPNASPAEAVEKASAEASSPGAPDRVERPAASGGSAAALGLFIAAAFIAGLALGFFGRPVLIQDLPVEVVVTAAPDSSETDRDSAAVVQAGEDEAAAPAASQADEAPAPTEEPAAGDGMPTPTIMDFVLSDARHFQGDEEAPVTVVEFSDFNCGYCGRFATETLDQLREAYIETGQVRFVYKHFAILGPTSTRAAEASECAADQEKFWAYHDTIFTNHAQGMTDLSDDSLIAQAADLELDVEAFSECLTSNKYSNQIQQEAMSVQSMGVRGTPGFLINGVFISGAQPFEVFEEVIEEQLASVDIGN